MIHNSGKIPDIFRLAVALADPLYQNFGIDCPAAFSGIPDKINIRHNRIIGKLKTFCEIIKQKTGSAVLMGLKNTP